MVKTQCLIPHLLEPTLPEAIASAVDQFEMVSMAYGYRGVQQTRNDLLMASTAEYISYLDADDYWLPNSALVLLEKLEQSGADGCYAPNQHGAVPADPLLAIITSRMNPSALWRRSALLAIAERFGEVWDTSYFACTDAIVYLRALQCGLKLVYCGQPAIYYRPGGTLTQDKCRWALAKHQLLDEIEAYVTLGSGWILTTAGFSVTMLCPFAAGDQVWFEAWGNTSNGSSMAIAGTYSVLKVA